jgi:hypothetical protein
MSSSVHMISAEQHETIQALVNMLKTPLVEKGSHSIDESTEEATGRATRARTRLIVEGFANLALVVSF